MQLYWKDLISFSGYKLLLIPHAQGDDVYVKFVVVLVRQTVLQHARVLAAESMALQGASRGYKFHE